MIRRPLGWRGLDYQISIIEPTGRCATTSCCWSWATLGLYRRRRRWSIEETVIAISSNPGNGYEGGPAAFGHPVSWSNDSGAPPRRNWCNARPPTTRLGVFKFPGAEVGAEAFVHWLPMAPSRRLAVGSAAVTLGAVWCR